VTPTTAEPTTEPPPTTAAPVEKTGNGTSTRSIAVLGVVLVILLGAGGGVGLYLTRDTDPL
jgi:hypothetical protein